MIFQMSTPKIAGNFIYERQAEQSDRDRWRDQVYAACEAIRQQVANCSLSPDAGVAQAQGLINDYISACGQFIDKATGKTCANYLTQPDAFPARLTAIRNAGNSCNKPAPLPAPVVTQKPVTVNPSPVVALPVISAPSMPQGGGGVSPACCQAGSGGGGLGLSLNGGNFGLSFGGGDTAPGGGGGGAISGGGTGGGGLLAANSAGPAGSIPAILQNVVSAVAGAVGQAVNGNGGVNMANILPDSSIATLSGLNVVDFPMRNPFAPLSDTMVPISGINAWPRSWKYPRRSIPGRVQSAKMNVPDMSMPGGVAVKTFNAPSNKVVNQSMSGFGDEDTPIIDLGNVGNVAVTSSPLPIYQQGVSLPGTQPSTLQSIFATISGVLPATISAIKGQPYYNTTQNPFGGSAQLQQVGVGTTINPVTGLPQTGAVLGASAGNIIASLTNFAAANPMMLALGGVGLFLLFREPPRRR